MERINTEEYRYKDTDYLMQAVMRDKGSADPAISVDMNNYMNLSLGKHYQVIRLGTFMMQYLLIPGVRDLRDDPILLAKQQKQELSKIVRVNPIISFID